MKFKDYYAITEETTDYSLKIIGIIFTSIALIIALIFGYQNNSINDSLEIFVLCFLLGNGFGFFIWLLAITSAYGKAKSIITFYNSIPDEVRNELGLYLNVVPENIKYNFLRLNIIIDKSDTPIYLDIDKKLVHITIINDLEELEHFQKRAFQIQKKYKKEKITLTGWGLRKTIKQKDCINHFSDKFELIINELEQISSKEDFYVIKK